MGSITGSRTKTVRSDEDRRTPAKTPSQVRGCLLVHLMEFLQMSIIQGQLEHQVTTYLSMNFALPLCKEVIRKPSRDKASRRHPVLRNPLTI